MSDKSSEKEPRPQPTEGENPPGTGPIPLNALVTIALVSGGAAAVGGFLGAMAGAG